jgi:hypothetical protein
MVENDIVKLDENKENENKEQTEQANQTIPLVKVIKRPRGRLRKEKV